MLVEKMKKSEREVIQDWLENIFKSWEKTNDLEIRVFKFTPLKHEDLSLIRNGGPGGILHLNNGSSNACGSPSNGHSHHGQMDYGHIERLVRISASLKFISFRCLHTKQSIKNTVPPF